MLLSLFVQILLVFAADLVEAFLQDEGMDVVLAQVSDPRCTEKTKQMAITIFMLLSYEESAINCMIRNGVMSIVLAALNEYPKNPHVCEPGLIALRNILRDRNIRTMMADHTCLKTVASVLKENPANMTIAKKACSIIQKVAFSTAGKSTIFEKVPEIVALMVESLKRGYKDSKSLCVDAMNALRNLAAGDFVFSLARLVPPEQIIPVSIEILKSYRSDSRVCASTCAFLWNMSFPSKYTPHI